MTKLTDAEFGCIECYVRDKYGVNLEKKRFLIESKLWIELARCKANNYTEYWNQLRADTTGVMEQRMVDLLTTNYSFFCREEAHFSFLVRQVLPELMPTLRTPLNLWCAACADGQECYTLGMTLQDARGAGLLRVPFAILGTDISQNALQKARAGRYGAAEYARLPEHWQKCYCTPFQAGEFRIQEGIRSVVHFRRENLLEMTPGGGPYHVIFCRNVMIYFKEAQRIQLVDDLVSRLAPGGYLFTGHTESLQHCPATLEYIRPAVYRKRRGSV